MKFWDASAIIPLVIDEVHTSMMRATAKQDGSLVVWWGSVVECYSACAGLIRDGILSSGDESKARAVLMDLADAWTEIEPSDDIRDTTRRLLQNYHLRAADSLQLAAALAWAGKSPKGHHFVCLDGRLRDAAAKEGFTVVPSRL